MKSHQHIPCFLRLLLLAAVMLPLAGPVQAQQRMRYSQYLQNGFLSNPGLTGVEPFWDIRAGISQQWVGIPGAPRSLYFTGHKGLYPKYRLVDEVQTQSLPSHGRVVVEPTTTTERVERAYPPGTYPDFHLGVGGQIFSEQTGPISYSGVVGSLAAHMRLTGKLRLGIGASMEMLNYSLNPASIEMLTANDITLTQNRVSLLLPTLNAGMVLYSQRFFVAASTRQLMRARLVVNPANPSVAGLETHYFAQAGLKLQLSPNFRVNPSVALRMVAPAPPSIDVSAVGSYKDQFFMGASYRHGDAVVLLAGVRLSPALRFDYAYDFTTSSLRYYSSGSHSLVLSIFPGIVKQGGRRFFW